MGSWVEGRRAFELETLNFGLSLVDSKGLRRSQGSRGLALRRLGVQGLLGGSGGLVSRVISTLKGILIGVMIL